MRRLSNKMAQGRALAMIAVMSLVLAACGTSGTTTTTAGGGETTTTAAPATTQAPDTTETTAPVDTTPIKIGVVNPTTGNFTVFGEQSNAGVQLYFDQIGSTIAGRPVELVYADTAGDPQQALEQARRLVEQEEVVALVGLVNSAVVVALADFADQNEVPLVVTVGSASGVTMPENASPWVNRVSVASGQEERPLGWYAATELGYENAAIVVWDFLSGNERGAAFSEVFVASGGEIINEQKPPPNATEYGPFLAAIEPEATQSMYVFAAGAGSVAFFQQYQDFGLGGVTPMGSGFLTAGILEELGETALGLVQTGQYTPLIDTPANQEFVAAYTAATGGEAGVYSSQGYIGAQAIALAIEALGGDTSDQAAISAAVRALEFESPAGMISFNEHGQVIRDIYVTRVVESGDGVTQEIIDVLEQIDQFWTP